MTTQASPGMEEPAGAFLSAFAMAAMLALATPLLAKPAPGEAQASGTPLFTPEQAADIIDALEALAVDHGRATSPAAVGSYGLVDAARDWAPGVHRNRLVRVTDSSGFTQTKVIQNNSGNTLIAQMPWTRTLDTASVYVILNS